MPPPRRTVFSSAGFVSSSIITNIIANVSQLYGWWCDGTIVPVLYIITPLLNIHFWLPITTNIYHYIQLHISGSSNFAVYYLRHNNPPAYTEQHSLASCRSGALHPESHQWLLLQLLQPVMYLTDSGTADTQWALQSSTAFGECTHTVPVCTWQELLQSTQYNFSIVIINRHVIEHKHYRDMVVWLINTSDAIRPHRTVLMAVFLFKLLHIHPEHITWCIQWDVVQYGPMWYDGVRCDN